MDPLTMMLIGGGVQAASGIIGYLASMPDRERARQIIESAIDENGKLNVPQLEQVVAEEVGPSAFENLKADPEAVAAQRSVLGRLSELADKGYGIEDLAAQTEALRRSGRQEQAGRQRIAADAAARGQLGAGSTLAMMLQNQQGAAERGADIGLQTAAQNQRRAMEALRDRGQFAGQMRGQDWQEKSQAAQAKDRIAAYNADARRSATQQRNANTQWTFGQQRGLADRNLTLAQMRSGIYGDQANQTAGMIAGAGAGLGQGFSAVGQAGMKPQTPSYDEWVKTGKAGGWY